MKANFLNSNVPEFKCFLRKEFLYNGKTHRGQFVPVVVFGISSIPGRALGFHVITDGGAAIDRIPIHALCWKKDAPAQDLGVLELWDCPGPYVGVHEFDFLAGLRCRTLLSDRKYYGAKYLFTIDWSGSPEADAAGDIGHKSAHLLSLDNGNLAAQPNNRIFWKESSFVTCPLEKNPGYRINETEWRCEDGEKWTSENSDRFFYK